MNKEESFVIDFFDQFDLKANKIPESSEESPDFFIECGEEKILVELKTKIDSQCLLSKREEALEKDGIHERFTEIKRDNAISKRIKKASKQLMAQKLKYEANYCFVFLIASGINPSVQTGMFETTLFGDKDIIPMGDEFDNGIKKCYYYTNSDFFNNREILDGAFIVGNESGRLCINSVSMNYSNAIKSKFVQIFRPGVLCPIELEKKGEAYLINAPLDRSNENELNRYLCKKYNLTKIVPFNYPQYTVTAQIKKLSD